MWQTKDDSLYKKFEFDSFEQSIKFINEVAEIAIAQDHHPKIINDYDKVEFWLTTHSVGSKITDQDQNMARLIDEAYEDTKV